MKKIMVSLLTAIMIISFCACGKSTETNKPSEQSSITSNSDSTSQKNELIYNSTEAFDYIEVEGGITIIEFKNYDKIEYSKVIIPSEIDGKKVVGIGSLDEYNYWVFADFSRPCEVVVPETVSYIGVRSFYHAKNLVKVSGGENCQTIGDFAFADCDDLEEVTFLNNVDVVSENAFSDCEKFLVAN